MSDSTSHHIASGILFEGCDFEEWQGRLRSVLFVGGGNAYMNCLTHPPRLAGLQDDMLQDVTRLVRAMVSIGLWERVTWNDQGVWKNFGSLMTQLEAKAKPFRLLDLPEEIRGHIFAMAFKRSERHRIVISSNRCGIRGKYPALLHASTQVRREAIPYYYRHTVFELHIPVASRSTQAVEDFELWGALVAKENLKHLREVRVNMSSASIHFTYCPQVGILFQITSTRFPFRALKSATLANHIDAIEALDDVANIGGKALFLLVTANPELWQPDVALLFVRD